MRKPVLSRGLATPTDEEHLSHESLSLMGAMRTLTTVATICFR